MIVIVVGLPGSGKSYFASELAKKIKAKYLNSDQLRFAMVKHRTYNEKEKLRIYQRLLAMTRLLILDEETVIVDATFYKTEIRQMFIDLAMTLQTKIVFIEIKADESIIRERVSKRRKGSEADFKVYLKIKKMFQPMTGKHLTLYSTQNNIDQMLEKAQDHLS